MKELRGKVAVVTGAGSGIGRGMAEAFAARGMRVVLADLNAERLRSAEVELAEAGADVFPVACDTSDAAAVQALAEAAIDRYGAIHVWCNNAGVVGGGDPWNGPLETWEWVLGVNVWGVIHGTRAALAIMTAQGEGHIVNTGSMASLIALPGLVAYAASKHAVLGITEALFAELQATGSPIGVSLLCPLFVKTQLVSDPTWSPSAGAPAATDNAVVAGVEQMLGDSLQSGMAPRQVGELVADAVERGQFWILTDEAMNDVVRQRFDGALAQRNPGS